MNPRTYFQSPNLPIGLIEAETLLEDPLAILLLCGRISLTCVDPQFIHFTSAHHARHLRILQHYGMCVEGTRIAAWTQPHGQDILLEKCSENRSGPVTSRPI